VSLSLELQSRAITILPVLIADGEIPSALAEIRHVDLRGDLDQGIEHLVEQLNVVHSLDFSRLDAHAFESLIVELLEQIGFSEVVREWHTAERTFDIKATYTSTDPFDAEREEVWLVEVKFYRNARADLNVIHQIVSYIERLPGRYKGLIITNGQLTSAAREWLTAAENTHRIAVRIIDGTELKRLLLNHPQLVRRYFHGDTIQ
jgi:restriction endonuclease Mrr